MKEKLFLCSLFLGLVVATTLPTKNLKTFRTRRNSVANGRLGIYDGNKTTITKHNYLVSLLYYSTFYCAGAIVSDSYVLTLADCAYGQSPSTLTVVAGSSDGVNGTSYNVKKIILNPNYSSDGFGSYDFALIKIKGTFTWGDDVGNVTLPSADPNNGTPLVAVGWGDTSVERSLGDATLLEGTMKYMNQAKCGSFYSNYNVTVDASMACAYNKGKTTMCNNDFDNPFTKKRVLYGLMAAEEADFCDADAFPVIIADVHSVVDWINEYI